MQLTVLVATSARPAPLSASPSAAGSRRKLTPFCIGTAAPDDKAVGISDSPSPSVCSPSQAAAAAASGDLPCGGTATTVAAGATADKPDAVTALRKFGVAVATAESEPDAEGTESPAATARTGTATPAGNIIPPVVANVASPATAAPAGVVTEPASDSHTHAASATAAEPAAVVTPTKCAELTATEGMASHRAGSVTPAALRHSSRQPK